MSAPTNGTQSEPSAAPKPKPATDTVLVDAVIAKLHELGIVADGKPIVVTRENLLDVLAAADDMQRQLMQRLGATKRKAVRLFAAALED